MKHNEEDSLIKVYANKMTVEEKARNFDLTPFFTNFLRKFIKENMTFFIDGTRRSIHEKVKF